MISFWCGPPLGGDYDAQYAEVAECNFTHAAFPCSGSNREENLKILDACQKHGLKYILLDGRLRQHAPGDANFGKNLDAVIADYANHPAMGGYYLADEPTVVHFAELAAVNEYLKSHDAKHLPFINMLPNYAPVGHLGAPSYQEFIEQYCTTVRPKLLCYDHYALLENDERPIYFANMEVIRRQGLKHDIPMGFIFLTTPHFGYRDPSETDLRWQVNTALAYGTKALFYFTYFTPTDPAANFHSGIIDAAGKRTHHYEMAKRINAELKRLGSTLMQLTSSAVYHTGELPSGCTALPKDASIQQERGGTLVVGFFDHSDGSKWAIVVNRDLRAETSATLRFDGVSTLKELSPETGELSAVALADGQATFEFPPGGIHILKMTH